MVPSSAFRRPSVCLRLQLRDILSGDSHQSRAELGDTARPQLCRSIHTSNRCGQRHDTHSPLHGQAQSVNTIGPNIRKIDVRDRHANVSNGRIIGKPGRRQRVVSEHLKTSFLSKPSSVIVLRDIKERQDSAWLDPNHATHDHHQQGASRHGHLPRSITAEEIEGYIASENLAPKNEEIMRSIEGLKPASSLMDNHEFDALVQRLSNGFTPRQLTHYLAKSREPEAIEVPTEEKSQSLDGSEDSESLRWQPGRTPIEQRHYHIPRKGREGSKAWVIDRLLRDIWKITVSSEEQEIGELETVLQPWQVSLLLDVTYKGKPSYQSLLKSEFLIKASVVQAYQPDNVLRITARRQDAEEILRQMKLQLLSVRQFDFDLTALKPTVDRMGMKPGTFLSYRRDDLDQISKLTRSLIEMKKDQVVRIYSFCESEQNTARHLLLGLLNIPPLRSFDMTFEDALAQGAKPSGALSEKIVHAPVSLSGSVHRRYVGLDLRRAIQTNILPRQNSHLPNTSPMITRGSLYDLGDLEDHAAAIATQLDSVVCHNNVGDGHAAQGSQTVLSDWSADFCYIVQNPSAFTDGIKSGNASSGNPKVIITHPQAAGFQSLAKYLEPLGEARCPRHIVVHMRPLPNASDDYNTLPRATISFQEVEPGGNLDLARFKMTLDEQILRTPLPSKVVDIRFKRQLYLDLRCEHWIRDKHLYRLSEMLRDSLRDGTQSLTANAGIPLQLPEWLVNRSKEKPNNDEAGHNYMEVPYLLEQCEVVQTHRLQPSLKAAHADIILPMTGDMLLEYQEVDGGAVGSSHSSLSLIATRPPSPLNQDDQATDGAAEAGMSQMSVQRGLEPSSLKSSLKMVNTALHIAELLSQARGGFDATVRSGANT